MSVFKKKSTKQTKSNSRKSSNKSSNKSSRKSSRKSSNKSSNKGSNKNSRLTNKHKIDLTIKQIKYRPIKGFDSSKLILNMSGTDMNSIIANTLRRVAYNDIPTYGFEIVNIQENLSRAFDNDIMRCRLRQLPINNIDTGLFYLPPKYYEHIDYYDKIRIKHENEKHIELVINAVNNTDEIMPVSTKDAIYVVDGKPEPYGIYDHPILLIDLLPKQVFKCQMRGVIGIGERDVIWKGCRKMYYEEREEDNILLTIESNDQISEYVLLIKCCKLIKYKLENIKKDIENRIKNNEIVHSQTTILELDNEDHTMGNLINNALQDNDNIIFSGLSKPDHLIKSVILKIVSDSTRVKSPIEPLYEVFNYLDNLFNHIENQLIKLSN